ncbi:hypothetical protein DM860_013751 [Cuscuta australis]|uniref:Uncharacterized protein n=1 Tax=Cuscuta australis TaxID=267555 RepID=A0A328DHT5_9ASTE|nr:hypothetical protein DM860_013751 [Cuscuta australis]
MESRSNIVLQCRTIRLDKTTFGLHFSELFSIVASLPLPWQPAAAALPIVLHRCPECLAGGPKGPKGGVGGLPWGFLVVVEMVEGVSSMVSYAGFYRAA